MSPETNSVYRTKDCDLGDKAVELLREKGIRFQDHVISKDEESKLKEEFHVKTTPQIFLEGRRIGGYKELARRFGKKLDDGTSYTPVIAVFASALALAIFTSAGIMGFMGYALAIFATLKFMDLEGFAKDFKKYDLVYLRFDQYPKAYPFIEMLTGVSLLSGFLSPLAGLLAIFAGSAGAYSVYQAVYVHEKDLNCACVGANSKAPLGIVSMIENGLMVLMGLALLFY